MTWVHFVIIALFLGSIIFFIVAGAHWGTKDSPTAGLIMLGLTLFVIAFIWSLMHTTIEVQCSMNEGTLNVGNQCVVETHVEGSK